MKRAAASGQVAGTSAEAVRLSPPVKAVRHEPAPSAGREEVMHGIVAAAFAQMRANETGVLHSDEPEYVHQMRVGLRRMRCALRLLPAADAKALPAHLRRDLKRTAAALGEVRDLDVLALRLEAALLPELPSEATRLRQLVRDHLGAARDRLRAQLCSVDHARMCNRVALWLARPAGLGRDDDLAGFARGHLRSMQARIARGAQRFPALGAGQRHRLRIEVKRARYAAEFFSCVFDPHAARAYIRALTNAQDLLGRLTDVNTQERLLRDFGVGATARAVLSGGIDPVDEADIARAFKACGRAAGYWQAGH